mgnify:CR=1 FL=1
MLLLLPAACAHLHEPGVAAVPPACPGHAAISLHPPPDGSIEATVALAEIIDRERGCGR